MKTLDNYKGDTFQFGYFLIFTWINKILAIQPNSSGSDIDASKWRWQVEVLNNIRIIKLHVILISGRLVYTVSNHWPVLFSTCKHNITADQRYSHLIVSYASMIVQLSQINKYKNLIFNSLDIYLHNYRASSWKPWTIIKGTHSKLGIS